MDAGSRIQYHLRELETARNPASPDHVMPPVDSTRTAVLDVGCGIGQTLVAAPFAPGTLLVGIDRDEACLHYGRSNFEHLHFVHATAESLPFADASFDRIISRVTLPYTDIPRVLREFSRVLRQGGDIWVTLHPFSRSLEQWRGSVRRLRAKEVVLRSYVLANGVLFHFCGQLCRLPFVGICESVQSEAAMSRELKRAGFDSVTARRAPQFVMTATKRCA